MLPELLQIHVLIRVQVNFVQWLEILPIHKVSDISFLIFETGTEATLFLLNLVVLDMSN